MHIEAHHTNLKIQNLPTQVQLCHICEWAPPSPKCVNYHVQHNGQTGHYELSVYMQVSYLTSKLSVVNSIHDLNK